MTPPRIGVAVMYHPGRRHRIARLAEACLPMRLIPVPDPDPAAFPSPLRTAKRAWAAWSPDTTHHLVLQDDVLPVAGFAAKLRDAVAARPGDALALYAHWNAPYNSYAIRQAAAGGAAWARLVPGEWVPTQGLVLPVGLAADLAAYLAGVDDLVRDDDTVIDRFLRERDRCVLAAVPHLLDHDETASVAGNAGHGVRRATVLLPGADLPPERWTAPPLFDKGAVMRAAGAPSWDFSVTFAFGTCFVGFLRPVDDDCVRHPFGRWSDWCGVLGLGHAAVLGPLAAYLASAAGRRVALTLSESGVSPATATELWAAAYLLGIDATPVPADSVATPVPVGSVAVPAAGHVGHVPRTAAGEGARAVDLVAPLRRAAVAGWVDSGLLAAEAARLTPGAREALIELALAALDQGLSDGPAGGRVAASSGGAMGGVLGRMAAREAEGFQRTACFPGPLRIAVVDCPVCGSGAGEAAAYLRTVEFLPMSVVPAGEEDGGPPGLRMAGCERLPVHGLILMAHLRERLPGAEGGFVTRSAFLIDRGVPLDRPVPPGALAAMDTAERWADAPMRPGGVMVLPVGTGAHWWAPSGPVGGPPAERWISEAARYGRGLDGHPLTPHAPEPSREEAARHRAFRDDLVRRRLTEITRDHPPGPRVNGPLDPARLTRPW
ncbi:hypothetical protein [Sphaerisporangium corydalis]|uniref:Uncharacterized protein n=1 Tax=Sphaerisporangium corydalis TaxID=1441875 RepID=A0ABV9ECL2_9ACTN|nr:hypothetical protein [Sphaerisporangium corydalis]